MRQSIARALTRLAGWLQGPRLPPALRSLWLGPSASILDRYRPREPSPRELLAELKSTAWTCASINASACATFPPRLFVTTGPNQPAPKCRTRALTAAACERLRPHAKQAQTIEEVVEHPLLALLRQVNPVHNSFDLWELTQLYLEVHGCAYWYLTFDDALGTPDSIWTLPAHQVQPRRQANSANLVDWYEFYAPSGPVRFRPEEIIAFRCPDPRDPYSGGLSPLRACYEQVALTGDYASLKRATYANHALPGVVVSPPEVMGVEERNRLEEQWHQKFKDGGAGQVLVAERGLKVDVLTHSLGDLAALADMKATREEIANAFHVPLPFLSGETNLANMQASNHLHKKLAIAPRLRRRDEKLNEQLIPLFDPSGRLFLASDDPTPEDVERGRRLTESDLRFGVRTINEVRGERGLPPVPWGDAPWR